MNKKLLIFTIVSLFGYQWCQGYTWKVYNDSGKDLAVVLIADINEPPSKIVQSKDVLNHNIGTFEYKGTLIGACLGYIFLYEPIGSKVYKFTGSKGFKPETVRIKKGEFITSKDFVGKCSSQTIMITKDEKTGNFDFKFMSNKDFEKLQKAKKILKPIEIPTKTK